MKIVYWILVITIFYVYFGYPVLLVLIRNFYGQKGIRKGNYYPQVSLLIAVYNEENLIKKRLDNILSLSYPKDKLEVIIISDACNDRTEEIVKDYEKEGIKLYRQNERKGKMAAFNDVAPKAKGEILIFSDADVIFQKDNIEMLVRNFRDPQVGCVAGKKIPITNAESYTFSEGLYWKYESFIKQVESDLGNLVSGACGSNLALRSCLYKTLDEKTMAEDLLLLLICISQGYRSVFEPDAVCYEFLLPSSMGEFRRKIRIVMGGIHAVLVGRHLLGAIDKFTLFELWSHKILRWFISFNLVLLLVINFYIKDPLYQGLLLIQIIFYSLALIGSILDRNHYEGKFKKLFAVPYYFTSMNMAAILGILKFCFNFHNGWVAYEKVRVNNPKRFFPLMFINRR